MSWPRRIWFAWTLVAHTLATTVFLVVVAEAAARFVVRARGHLASARAAGRVAAAYPGWPLEDIATLQSETYQTLDYEPYTGFRERPRTGRYVNVSTHGFRMGHEQGSWPPDPAAKTVFVFGGSTAFGYGVADADTIPAHLQTALRQSGCQNIAVYNFGRGHYYSTQERILMERLLSTGVRPSVAVFIDGLNDSGSSLDEPPFADAYARLFRVVQNEADLVGRIGVVASGTALGNLASSWRAMHRRPPQSSQGTATAKSAAARWQACRRLAEASLRAAGSVPLFVVQPVAVYHRAAGPEAFPWPTDEAVAARAFYETLATLREAGELDGCLWLADVQQPLDSDGLYIDEFHYSGRFSSLLGNKIAHEVRRRLPGSDCRSGPG